MITPQQVTAMLAQTATSVDIYPAYDVNGNLLEGWQLNFNAVPVYIGAELGTRGIGIYGQSVYSLILTGYIKSAATNLILDASLVTTVLSSPAVWTGLNGINSLLDYLSSEDLQNRAQVDLMIGAYQGFIDAGIFIGNQTARFEATFLQPASRYGVDVVLAWINGELDADTANILTVSARQGQYAIDFMASNTTAINTIPEVSGVLGTTVRTAVDQAVSDIIGDDRIPAIDFGGAVSNVAIPPTTNEDGTFRFAPGNPAA